MADFGAEFEAMAAVDPSDAVGELVVVDAVALREAVASDAAVALPADAGDAPVGGGGGDAGDADGLGEVGFDGDLLAEQVGEAVIGAEDVDDGGGEGGSELGDFVGAGGEDLRAAEGNERSGRERRRLVGLAAEEGVFGRDEPIDADGVLVVVENLDGSADEIGALDGGAGDAGDI